MASTLTESVLSTRATVMAWVVLISIVSHTEARCQLEPRNGTFETPCSGDVNTTCQYSCDVGFQPEEAQILWCLPPGNWSVSPTTICEEVNYEISGCYDSKYRPTTKVVGAAVGVLVVFAVVCVVGYMIYTKRKRDKHTRVFTRRYLANLESLCVKEARKAPKDLPPTYNEAMNSSTRVPEDAGPQRMSSVEEASDEEAPPSYEYIARLQSLRGHSHV